MNSDIDNLYCSTPLDTNQIRILHLQPNADFTSDIRGDLEVISLNPGNSQAKTPSKPYRALSYVWGDESNKKPIFVNDIPLNVTSNLVLALRRLRAHHGHEHTPLTLWVDAVCINQTNDIERGDQVSLMGAIYKSCTEVCIWLGPLACESIPTCLKWDDLIASPTITPSTPTQPIDVSIPTALEQIARDVATLATSPPNLHLTNLPPHTPSPLATHLISAMTSLSTTPWFTRAWVVQEALLAPNAAIYFGHILLPQDKLWNAYATRKHLMETCDCCQRGEDSASPGLRKAMSDFFGNLAHLAVIRDPVGVVGRNEVSTEPYLALAEFSIRRRGQGCKDPRDRVYAYLGVVGDMLGGAKVGMGVDYRVGVGESVESKAAELYLGLCCDVVRMGMSLEFLAWNTGKNLSLSLGVGNLRDGVGGSRLLPSWVLDWTYYGGLGESTHLFDCRRWDAARGVPFKAEVIESVEVRDMSTGDTGCVKSMLACTGRRIDRVARVGLEFQKLSEDVCLNWHSITGLREKDAGDKPYPSGGTWGDAWWKALCFVTDNSQTKWTEKDICGLELVNAIVSNQHYNYLPKMKVSKACSEALPVRELVSSQPAMATLWKESITPIQNEINMRLDGKVLFVTENGYLGFSMAGVQEGDGVFLVGGCRAPIVLRETKKVVSGSVMIDGGDEDIDGKILYELMSGAFIYGIMDGELEDAENLPALGTVCVF